jgi:hypothetical protein
MMCKGVYNPRAGRRGGRTAASARTGFAARLARVRPPSTARSAADSAALQAAAQPFDAGLIGPARRRARQVPFDCWTSNPQIKAWMAQHAEVKTFADLETLYEQKLLHMLEAQNTSVRPITRTFSTAEHSERYGLEIRSVLE